MTVIPSFSLAIVGDIHGHFDREDVAYFNDSDYDAVLFLGDFPTYLGGAKRIAKLVSKLNRRAFFMPGNHDAVTLVQLATEVGILPALSPAVGFRQEVRMGALRQLVRPAETVGYSQHTLSQSLDLGMICGRPHSMGGRLNFPGYLSWVYGVRSLEQSATLLRRLIDNNPHQHLLIVGHNGPSGLGTERGHLFGCDFKKEACDWGDVDLRAAIDYAQATGRTVLSVVGGHMHHQLKGGGVREWLLNDGGVTYLNAARVPRIFKDDKGAVRRHHVRLALTQSAATAEAVLV